MKEKQKKEEDGNNVGFTSKFGAGCTYKKKKMDIKCWGISKDFKWSLKVSRSPAEFGC